VNLLEETRSIEPEIIRTRRAVHQRPELSFHERATSKLVADRLRSMGIEAKTGVGGTGVLGTLRGVKRGRVVALRADMDALPVQEMTDVAFKSRVKGVMHACGHDTHVAMLLGAAKILAKHRKELHGVVKFIFQPAEEHGGIGGAKPMIDDGVMKNPKVDYVFGLHIENRGDSGEFGVRPGAFMAAPDAFEIRIIGRGGHGSAPHETVDPIYVAAHVTLALQGVSSRMVDPVQPFVITVGSVHSGTKDNIIPDDAILKGTIRTLDNRVRKFAKAKVEEVAKTICKAFGASCKVEFMKYAYPVTYNDPKATEKVMEVLKTIPGTKVKMINPVLGGEDFSRFLEKAPGTFYFLGTHNPARGCVYPNHSSRFKVDEDVLKFGTASLVAVAMAFTNPKGP
jgi:carboxypeptidase Ss1